MRAFVRQVSSVDDRAVKAARLHRSVGPFTLIAIDEFGAELKPSEALCLVKFIFCLAPNNAAIIFARCDTGTEDPVQSPAHLLGLRTGLVPHRGGGMPFVVVNQTNCEAFARLFGSTWSTTAGAGHWLIFSVVGEASMLYALELIQNDVGSLERLRGQLFATHALVGLSFDDALVDIFARDCPMDLGEVQAALNSVAIRCGVSVEVTSG